MQSQGLLAGKIKAANWMQRMEKVRKRKVDRGNE
jgi:hypothetical protein